MMYFAHKHHRKNSLITLTILSIILLLVGTIVYLIITEKLPPASSPPAGKSPPVSVSEKITTFKGQIVCLPHKNPGDVQTLECAFGLIDPQGMYYSLRDTDPEYQNVSSAPMQVPVEVKGTYTPEENNIYPTVGFIDVESISTL